MISEYEQVNKKGAVYVLCRAAASQHVQPKKSLHAQCAQNMESPSLKNLVSLILGGLLESVPFVLFTKTNKQTNKQTNNNSNKKKTHIKIVSLQIIYSSYSYSKAK